MTDLLGLALVHRGAKLIVRNEAGVGRAEKIEGAALADLEMRQIHDQRRDHTDKEADDEIRKIKEVNSGVYWFEVDYLLNALGQLTKSEKTGEYYLTDTVYIIKNTGKTVLAYKAKNADSVLGANDCIQLAQLNEIARKRILEKHMKNGVNIPCTDGVMIGTDVEIEANTLILPSSVIRGNTKIGAFCSIGPSALIDDCVISDDKFIGNSCLKNQNM